MNTAATPPAEKRSQLITIFAWINIVLAILGALVIVLMMLLFRFAVPMDDLMAMLQRPEMQQQAPHALVYTLSHIQALLGAALAFSILTLIASHALLKRRNWARLFWIVTMSLVVVWCIAGIFFQPDVAQFMPPELNRAPPEVQAQMKAMIATVKIYGIILSLVQAGVFGWAVWRFCSADIRSEFKEG
jgi:hypothetical protein